jgi:hypothetical protein
MYSAHLDTLRMIHDFQWIEKIKTLAVWGIEVFWILF